MPGEERRKTARIEIKQLAHVTSHHTDTDSPHDILCSTADLSEGGMRLKAEGGYAAGSEVVISFIVSGRIVEAKGRVVHFALNKDGAASMGIQFTDLSDTNRIFIEKYCGIRRRLE